MKLIKPYVERLEQGQGLQGIYDAICQAASTCYGSQAKTGESAKAFVDKLISNGHLAMLEFGTVYLDYPAQGDFIKYRENPYSKVRLQDNGNFAISINYRALVENNWLDDLQYLCEPTKAHMKRHTVKCITSIGIGRELLRHRKMSFANESTRYINYTKEEKGGEVTFIIPSWVEHISNNRYNRKNLTPNELAFAASCQYSEMFYKDMIDGGATAQEARDVLPLSTKSELCMCGFEDDWEHFYDLRLYGKTGKPHPDMQILAQMIYDCIK